jgi:hypothetical protein
VLPCDSVGGCPHHGGMDQAGALTWSP